MKTRARSTSTLPKTLIGSPGIGIHLRMSKTPDGLEVTLTNGFYFFVVGAFALFGPGFILLFLSKTGNFNPPTDSFLFWAFALVAVACTYAMFHFLYIALFARPKLYFHPQGIFHTVGRAEKWHIRTPDIASFRLEDYWFESEGNKTRNPILIVESQSKESTQLAICSDAEFMEELLATARSRFGHKSA